MSNRKAVILLDAGSQNAGAVDNIIECTAEGLRGLRFPLGMAVWDCGQYPVAIGDRWADGVFTRNGAGLIPTPNEEQRIAELEAAMSILAGGTSHA